MPYCERHTKKKWKLLKAPFSRVVIVIAKPNYQISYPILVKLILQCQICHLSVQHVLGICVRSLRP